MNQRENDVDNILNRGIIVDVLPDKNLFRERLLSKDPMRFYIGADPTSSALHLSHAKNYMLLEEFRKLGHKVIVLFGDFTARIGDPTDRSSARTQLTKEDVVRNVKGWIEQIKPLMDFNSKDNPPEIVYNNDWLAKLSLEDVLGLAANFTVQQMLERDMFEKRMNQNQPIHLHEFMYPLMQGYDSVALDVDVELCGTDQTFNAMVGRTLVKRFKDKEKFVVTVNLMENPITGKLMSKSQGTGIFLNLNAFNMYGSIMAQPDEMIEVFLINNTRVPLAKVKEILSMDNPRDSKAITALEIVKIFHGADKAKEAQEKFVSLVQDKSIGEEDIPVVHIEESSINIIKLLQECLGGSTSSSQIRRLIEQKSIKIDEVAVEDNQVEIKIPADGLIIKVGKKKWFKVITQ